MQLEVFKKDGLFTAKYTPRNSPEEAWEVNTPMSFDDLFKYLSNKKIHPVDIADAFIILDRKYAKRFGVDDKYLP